MKTDDFRHALVVALRRGDLSSVAPEIIQCVGTVHTHERVPWLMTKLLHRHRNRPGRRRDPDRDQRMKDAIIWVRFNRAALGKKDAIERAAKEFKLTVNALTAAYEGRVRKFRNL